ncbi:MAG TPA: hypothetical protein VGF56_14915 [Rhizomicrobium sp.]|jgi:hypothetical protein
MVLAVVFLAAMFAVAQMQPHMAPPLYVQAAGDVDKNFVGEKRLGHWILVCLKPTPKPAGTEAAIPFSMNPDPKTSAAATAAAAQSPMGRCLVTLQYPRKDNPKAVLMAVNFRFTRDLKTLAMVFRFPAAMAQKGDTLNVLLGRKAKFPIEVRDCVPNGFCTALGYLGAKGQGVILNVHQGMIVFPAKKGAKPLGVPVPFVVLKDAFAAMKRAES